MQWKGVCVRRKFLSHIHIISLDYRFIMHIINAQYVKTGCHMVYNDNPTQFFQQDNLEKLSDD